MDGLNQGLRLGLIASGDSHYRFAGVWGTGLVAAQAESLTRESIWNAFFQRRVYAATGDRILLDYSINDCPMGGQLRTKDILRIKANVTGSDALDRIELIRDGRVIATLCHADTWPKIPDKNPLRFKVRVECGWGPKPANGYDEEEKQWTGQLRVANGRILSVEGCFTSFGQRINRLEKQECTWELKTSNVGPFAPWKAVKGPHVPFTIGAPGNQAIIFELEMPRSENVELVLNNTRVTLEPSQLLQRSHLTALLEEARRNAEEKFKIKAEEVENPDSFYFNSWKIKIHRAAPESAYKVSHVFEDSPPRGRHYYYLRISQLNGQMAWSSPIWVENGKKEA